MDQGVEPVPDESLWAPVLAPPGIFSYIGAAIRWQRCLLGSIRAHLDS